ncbi:Rhodanese-like protein [Coemansia reversa NRRL 1564]|uniref:Rhodanese-like protein n=1 Tax=Coemansia reversa (strain ATCC 12441 / NRRL 1564) TaxID=763665 RepID=A0A2G5BCJ9_COERN|nr:Rhodanese-like protein [Coemansia reversa NRRL 1564]|eukprot:PIA16738.1 Rhodanese-like protein [Coemansia reversa NRRL 1564]
MTRFPLISSLLTSRSFLHLKPPMEARISAVELAKLVRDKKKKPGVDYLIVDVRDEDYKVGHIPGAVNIPSHDVYLRAGELIGKYKHVPQIVFHCALSQQRGPKSARIYKEIVQERLKISPSSDPLANQSIQVLDKGFVGWADTFLHTEPNLIEDFDRESWDAL